MNGVTSAILLQAEGAPAGPDYSFFVMMGMIFLIFYVLVMRPQQRQQKEKEEAIKNAVKGDKVITAGGLHGTVTKVGDETLTIEIARVKGGASVEVDVAKARVESIGKKGGEKKADEKKGDKKKEGSDAS